MRTLRFFFSVFGEFQVPPIDDAEEDGGKKTVLVRVDSALEPVHMETLFCVNTHVLPIVHTDPVNAVPENALF